MRSTPAHRAHRAHRVTPRPRPRVAPCARLTLLVSALTLTGCLPEPALTYPEPPLDFGAPAAPLTPRLEPEEAVGQLDMGALDAEVPDAEVPDAELGLRSLNLSWVGESTPTLQQGEVRVVGSFEWVSGTLNVTSGD